MASMSSLDGVDTEADGDGLEAKLPCNEEGPEETSWTACELLLPREGTMECGRTGRKESMDF